MKQQRGISIPLSRKSWDLLVVSLRYLTEDLDGWPVSEEDGQCLKQQRARLGQIWAYIEKNLEERR